MVVPLFIIALCFVTERTENELLTSFSIRLGSDGLGGDAGGGKGVRRGINVRGGGGKGRCVKKMKE